MEGIPPPTIPTLPKVYYYNIPYYYIFILFKLYMQVEEEQENLRKRQEVCIL